MTIKKIARSIRWRDGVPIVRIAGKDRRVTSLLANGDSNTKLRKSSGGAFITAGLSLSPSNESGIGNVCPHASTGCRAACLDHQGLASIFQDIRAARIAKTVVWYRAREWFLDTLRNDIERYRTKAQRDGKRLAVRLNVFSDIPWERYGIIDEFPDIQFYDYTKAPKRAGLLRHNYWVTFSRSESNYRECLDVLSRGNNVAIAFADRANPFVSNKSKLQTLPSRWAGAIVSDGDETDLRFDDERGRVIGLRLKAHSYDERINAIKHGFAVEFN